MGAGRLGLHGDRPLTTFSPVILRTPRGNLKDVDGREAANGTYEQKVTRLHRGISRTGDAQFTRTHVYP